MSAGNLIREFRKNRGLSQQEFASWTGVNHSVISRIENGQILLSPKYIRKIKAAKVFGDIELESLCQEAANDLFVKSYQLDTARNASPSPIESYEVLIEGIRKKRRLEGITQGSIHTLPLIIENLKKLQEKYVNEKNFPRLIGLALVELLETQTEVLTENEIKKLTKVNLGEITFLREALTEDKDKEYFDMTVILPAIIMFIAKNFEDSYKLYGAQLNRVSTSHALATCVADRAVAGALMAVKGQVPREMAISQYYKDQELALATAERPEIKAGGRSKIKASLALAQVLLNLPNQKTFIVDALADYHHSLIENDKTFCIIHRAKIARVKILSLLKSQDVSPEEVAHTFVEGVHIFTNSHYIRYYNQSMKYLEEHPDKGLQERIKCSLTPL